MRNEQEFKALVLQKVADQQYQKKMRLQKIRAATATLSALCLVVIGVVAIVWFVKANPGADYGSQDGPYGGMVAPKNWFSSWFSGVSEEEGDWGNSTAIMGDSSENNEADVPEEAPQDFDNTDSDRGESIKGESSDKVTSNISGGNANSSADSNNSENSDGFAEDAAPESESGDAPTVNSGSSVDTESTPIRLTLEDLAKNTATMLALEGGYTEDPRATSKLFDAINNCLDTATPALIEPGELLFTIRNGTEDGMQFQIYDNNILVLLDNDSSVSYEITPAALQALLRTLQATEFSPID